MHRRHRTSGCRQDDHRSLGGPAGRSVRLPRVGLVLDDDRQRVRPPYRTEAHEQNATVVRAFAAAASALAAGGYTVVLEGIVGPWFLHLVVEECARNEVPLSYVVLRPSRGVALTRATYRVDEMRVLGHPPLADGEVIGRMWDVFADLGDLEPLVIDNSALSASEAADRVWDRFVAGGLRLPSG